jgi:hypothetical protein
MLESFDPATQELYQHLPVKDRITTKPKMRLLDKIHAAQG